MAKKTKAAGTLLGTKTGRKATVAAGKTASKAATRTGKTQARPARQALSPSQPTNIGLLKYGLFALGLLIEKTRVGAYAPQTTTAAGTLFGTNSGRKATAIAGKSAGRAALGVGKAQVGLARQALSSSEPAGPRLLKYGLFALAGFTIGALVARSAGGSEDSSSSAESTLQQSSDGADRQGTQPESGIAEAPLQMPEDPNRTGAERGYSDPSGGPLIGRSHNPEAGDVPVQHEELENRIRSRIGEDPRTLGLQHLNVEVNDDVADIRGVAPSQTAKEAVSEIAAETPGVREVHNLMTVSS